MFNELSHMIPSCEKAVYFTSAYNTTRYLLGIRCAACPEMFKDSITSGVKTSSLATDGIVLQLAFSGALGTLQQVNSFLNSDVVIFSDPSTRDLQKKIIGMTVLPKPAARCTAAASMAVSTDGFAQ